MFNYVFSAAYYGLQGYIVKVEAHIARGLPRFKIVGLPDKSVEESKERVTAAIKSSGYTFPLKRITINLAPSHIPKHGPSLDLPIALGVLLASGQIPRLYSRNFPTTVFCGELGLDGSLKPIKGMPILLEAASSHHFHRVIAPPYGKPLEFRTEVPFLPAKSLREAVLCTVLSPTDTTSKTISGSDPAGGEHATDGNLSVADTPPLIGCESELRSMSIAIAGHLNIALYGPPGSGKTLLAQSSIHLSPRESDTSRKQRSLIYSVSDECFPERYPFRQPPSSISLRSMFGGGTSLTLGEVTLAHTGFLFMDEFPDFKNEIMMSLKKVLDLRTSVIFHQKNIIKLPADFILITAMNNCPCGYWGHPKKECTCQEYRRKQYLSRISTALWDRIELHVDMKPQSVSTTLKESKPDYLQTMRKNIEAAVNMQEHRKNRNDNISLSSAFSKYTIQPGAREMLRAAQLSLGLSTRKLLHTFRIARTIADLEQVESIKVDHVEEALSYRKQEY